MDEGWSVVLGAVIALTGSALIPWVREALSARAQARRERIAARRTAAAELIAANTVLGFTHAFEDQDGLLAAVDRRSLAGSQLLIAAEKGEREKLSILLDRSMPLRPKKSPGPYPPRVLIFALQGTLSAWAGGDLPESSIITDYEERLKAAPTDLYGT